VRLPTGRRRTINSAWTEEIRAPPTSQDKRRGPGASGEGEHFFSQREKIEATDYVGREPAIEKGTAEDNVRQKKRES